KKAYRFRMFGDHSIHEERNKLHNKYAMAMDMVKMTCWMEWLEAAGSSSIWEICSFISQPFSD
ncbi:uncharacterized protein EV420DRAFT_1237400, partial [Desarmillaria tabescens]